MSRKHGLQRPNPFGLATIVLYGNGRNATDDYEYVLDAINAVGKLDGTGDRPNV